VGAKVTAREAVTAAWRNPPSVEFCSNLNSKGSWFLGSVAVSNPKVQPTWVSTSLAEFGTN